MTFGVVTPDWNPNHPGMIADLLNAELHRQKAPTVRRHCDLRFAAVGAKLLLGRFGALVTVTEGRTIYELFRALDSAEGLSVSIQKSA